MQGRPVDGIFQFEIQPGDLQSMRALCSMSFIGRPSSHTFRAADVVPFTKAAAGQGVKRSSSNTVLVIVLASVLALFFSPLNATAAGTSDVHVEQEIDQLLHALALGDATVTFHCVDLELDTVLATQDAEQSMIPASNMKLITTGAALLGLGIDFRFQTQLLRTTDDSVIIHGSGDPGLGDPDLLREMKITVDDLVNFWIEDIQAAKITNIPELIIDDRVFDSVFHHPSWMAEDLVRSYGAQVAGFNFYGNVARFYFRPSKQEGIAPTYRIEPNIDSWIMVRNKATSIGRGTSRQGNALWLDRKQNTNDFTISGKIRLPGETTITVHDPAEIYGQYIRKRFQDQGILVQNVRSAKGDEQFNSAPFGRVIQTRLDTVLRRANTDSENMYAEALLKRLGHAGTGQSGSWANGAAIIRAQLSKHLGPGLATQAVISDGSGLSRDNRLTALLLTHWLGLMYGQSETMRNMYLDSLAVANETGTLRKRFKTVTVDDALVRGKSGYMRGVSCLSGYVTSDAGHTCAYAILVNDIPARIPTAKAKELQEKIVRILGKYVAEQDTKKNKIVTHPGDDRPKHGG